MVHSEPKKQPKPDYETCTIDDLYKLIEAGSTFSIIYAGPTLAIDEEEEKKAAKKRQAQAPGEKRGKKKSVSGANLAQQKGKSRDKVAKLTRQKLSYLQGLANNGKTTEALPEKNAYIKFDIKDFT